MKNALWCSAHTPTEQQVTELTTEFGASVVLLKDLSPELQEKLNNTPSDAIDLRVLALELLSLSCKKEIDFMVQPGGSPAFQFTLGAAREDYPTAPDVLYAHSERVSIDQHQEDGSVIKTSVFRHVEFIRV
jgi:hypothetical protein